MYPFINKGVFTGETYMIRMVLRLSLPLLVTHSMFARILLYNFIVSPIYMWAFDGKLLVSLL